MMTTDIDMLHKTLETKHSPRNLGKTYAQCQLVAGHVEVGEKNIFVTIAAWEVMTLKSGVLRTVFREHELEFKPQAIRSIIKSGESTIRFILNNGHIEDSMHGLEGLIINC